MDYFEVTQKRHSYRGLYKQEAVSREHLRKIMEAGLLAPSGCNAQTTSLIAVDDPALLKQLGAILKKPTFASAPAAIYILSKETVVYAGRSYHVQDYSAAIENMLLAITALGYASCWVEGYVNVDPAINQQMAALLNIPADYQLVAMLPVGIPEQEGRQPQKRPFSERAWFNGFRKNDNP